MEEVFDANPEAAVASSTEVQFLIAKIEENIMNFEDSADFNRRWAFGLRISVASLGAITTVLVGISSIQSFDLDIVRALAIATSAAIPIVVGWDAFYDYHWLWVKYTGAYTRLKNVKDKQERIAATGRAISAQEMNELYAEYRAALDETNGAWLEKRATPSSMLPKGGGQ